MTSEERDIIQYLKSAPRVFVSGREIARRAAGKKFYQEQPDWARAFLPKLVEKGYLEMSGNGHFRIKPVEDVEAKGRKWVSPQVARLLKESGKEFGGAAIIELEEEG